MTSQWPRRKGEGIRGWCHIKNILMVFQLSTDPDEEVHETEMTSERVMYFHDISDGEGLWWGGAWDRDDVRNTDVFSWRFSWWRTGTRTCMKQRWPQWRWRVSWWHFRWWRTVKRKYARRRMIKGWRQYRIASLTMTFSCGTRTKFR